MGGEGNPQRRRCAREPALLLRSFGLGGGAGGGFGDGEGHGFKCLAIVLRSQGADVLQESVEKLQADGLCGGLCVTSKGGGILDF